MVLAQFLPNKNSKMKGACLCGEVSFKLSDDLPPIYQCHCSLCRKVSGSASNSALIVSKDKFEWISGQHHIRSYSTRSGFKSEFCESCGSPAPNLSSDGKSYWVPAGLLSEPVQTEVLAHVYVNSRANWDTGIMNDRVAKFAAMPSDKEWLEICANHGKHR